MRILKMMLGASVFMINSAHKNFHGSVHWTSLDKAINRRIHFISPYVTITAVTSNSICSKNITKKI